MPIQRCMFKLLCGFIAGCMFVLFANRMRCFQGQAKNATSVFIGMMSSAKYAESRVFPAYKTWAKNHRPYARIEVFSDQTEATGSVANGYLDDMLKYIQLPGVNDNTYPPMKKYYSMLLYMYRAHIDQHDWFLRTDDDAYVDVRKLRRFLSRCNASRILQIGTPGFGQTGGDKLYLGKHLNYCKTGSGVIFSRGLLKVLAPRLRKCLEVLYTKHDDVELGRCVNWVSGTLCTNAFDAHCLFFQNYDQTTKNSHIASIDEVFLDEGIIFHSNKEPHHQYAFHSKVLKNRVKLLVKKIGKLQKEINFNSVAIKTTPVWNSVVRGRQYTPRLEAPGSIKSLYGKTLDDDLQYYMGHLAERACMVPTLRDIPSVVRSITLYSYHAVDANGLHAYSCHGVKRKQSTIWSRKISRVVLRTRKRFGGVFFSDVVDGCTRDEAQKVESTLRKERKLAPVTVVLHFGDQTRIKQLAEQILSLDRQVRLFVAAAERSQKTQIEAILPRQSTKNKFLTAVVESREPRAILSAAASLVGPNEILFLAVDHLDISGELIARIRANTAAGCRAYAPLVKSSRGPASPLLALYGGDLPRLKFARTSGDGYGAKSKGTNIKMSHPKDPISSFDQRGVVYSIPCADCSLVYIGETGRSFKTRRNEHQRDVANNDPKKSALSNHAISKGHQIDFSAASIIARESDYRKRLFLESWNIHKKGNTMNIKTDVMLSACYKHLLKD